MDYKILPDAVVSKLSLTERVDYCLGVFSRLASQVGDDAFLSALNCCHHVHIPRVYPKSELWTD